MQHAQNGVLLAVQMVSFAFSCEEAHRLAGRLVRTMSAKGVKQHFLADLIMLNIKNTSILEQAGSFLESLRLALYP